MLRRGFKRVLARRVIDLKALAVRQTVVCPAETTVTRAAIYAEEDLSKIRKLSPWRNWDIENRLIRGGPQEHAASVVHEIHDAAICGAYIYAGAAKLHVGYGAETLWRKDNSGLRRLPAANLVTTKSGSHFFGHLIVDDFPLSIIEPRSPNNVRMVSKHYEHEAGYRNLLDLEDTPPLLNARVRNLKVFTDYGQNSFKAARYRELRSRLRAGIGLRSMPPPPGVYLKRGGTGEPRVLENEDQVEAVFKHAGFVVADPSTMSAEQLASSMVDTPLVVGIEGSHLSHAVLAMREGGTLLVLQPPDRFAMAYKEFVDALDFRFGFLVGDSSANGFTVPTDQIRRMLEKVT